MHGRVINKGMKAVLILSLAVLISGCCSPSKYAKDPRAGVVGPDYLEYIAQYPRDRDTQYYYPLFVENSLTNWVDTYHNTSKSSSALGIETLIIDLPEPTAEAKAITGKGWPELEHTGIPF